MGKDGEKSVYKRLYRERSSNECNSLQSAQSAKNSENGSLERFLGSENVDPKAQSAHSSPQLGGKSFSVLEHMPSSPISQTTRLPRSAISKASTVASSTVSSSTVTRRPYQQKTKGKETSARNGRWSLSEHLRFLEALKLHGKNWKLIEEHIATRTST